MGFKMKRSNMAGGIMIDRKPDGHMPDFRAKSAPLQMKSDFKPHKMYKDGKVVTAKTHQEHVDLGKQGFGHEPPTNYGKAVKMQDDKKKKKPSQGDFVPAYPGADISEAEYKKMKALGIKSEQDYSAYKAAKDKKAWLAKNVKNKTNTTTAKK